ncbi:MAG: DMT family transporter [Thermosipho sp. (in: Bacteria)]|nr:DMT family transporter [Thermosipho sp. (in: thermotogales)]
MHYFAAIASAFSSSVTSIFGKISLNVGASALQILFLRFLFSLLLSFIFFLLFKRKFNLKSFIFFGFMGIINYGIAAYFFFSGLRFLNPAYATVLFFTNPIFVLIFQMIIYKNKMNFLNIFSVVLSFVGVFFSNIGEQKFSNFEGLFIGTFLVISAAVINALFIAIVGEKLKRFSLDPIESVFYTFLGVSIMYLFISVLTKEIFTLKIDYVGYGLLLAIFSTFIPLTLNFFSLKKLSSHTVAIIMPLEIVFASILSFIIFGESFNFLKIIGFVLVGMAPVVENLKFAIQYLKR